MTETLQQIKAAVMNGLTRPEIEGLLGRKLEEDEVQEFNKTKALLKLKERQEEIDKQASGQQSTQLVSAGITNNLQPKLPPLKDRYTKEQIKTCIEAHYGVVTRICNELDCTYSQFYKTIKQLGLQEDLAEAKKNLVSLAEKTLLEALASVDEKTRVDVAKYILKTQGKAFGWNEGPQIAQQINVQGEVSIKEIFGIDD